MVLRSILPWALASLLGLGAGLASAVWLTGEAGMRPVPADPSWSVDALAGAQDANLYTRARIARIGLLALNRKEAVYYIAERDAHGARLMENCRYAISGGELPGQWWSLTVYAQDRFLARNQNDAHSVGAQGLGLDADGRWQVELGPERPTGTAWLSSRGSGEPSIALRIYRPAAAVVARPLDIRLPRIERLACANGATT